MSIDKRRVSSTVQDEDPTANSTALLVMKGKTQEKLAAASEHESAIERSSDNERARRVADEKAKAVGINGFYQPSPSPYQIEYLRDLPWLQ